MQWLFIFRRNPFVLPTAVVAALAIFFLSEGSYLQSLDTIGDLRGNTKARLQIERLERSLVDAETGQRGYLLTGNKTYLQPYNDARSNIGDALSQLDRHFAGDSVITSQVRALRALSERRLLELDEAVRLMQAGQQQTALNLVLSGIGKEDMDSLRTLTGRLMQDLLAQRNLANTSLDGTLLLSRYGVAALSAVLLLALVLYLRKSDALAAAQAGQKQLLQAAFDRLESEVAMRTAELTDLTRHLLTAREDERQRLARNLHDDLGSLLTAAKLDAARVRSRLGEGSPEAQARLADLVDKLNSGIALGRRIIEDLRPSTLSHLGLPATLDILLRDFSAASGVAVHSEFMPVHLTPAVELVSYRVVQEAITNLSKYAQARNVWLTLGASRTRPGRVELVVRDDGVGFDELARRGSTYGLLGMRFRVESVGGSLQVQTRPGEGTTVSASLPALQTHSVGPTASAFSYGSSLPCPTGQGPLDRFPAPGSAAHNG